MTKHMWTAVILLAALALYAIGWQTSAWGLFAGGVLFEGWFWVRLLARPNAHSSSSH